MTGADYSIADIPLLGWERNLIGFYEARELVGFDRDRGFARLLEVELMLRGVIRERRRRLGFRPLANKLARRESLDLA